MKSESSLEVFFTPADFAALAQRDLSHSICVVFDVLRATTSIVAALYHGAEAMIPVAEIPEALAWRQKLPYALLAGERDGFRIRADLTGGVDFDLGNSPREFTRAQVEGKTIIISTTNGSRALRACAQARLVLATSFPNLDASVEYVRAQPPGPILLVCSGTFEQAAYEDVLAAGAMASLLASEHAVTADSAIIARQIFERAENDLSAAMEFSRNARRLRSRQELSAEVDFCLQRDALPVVARMKAERIIATPA